MSEDFELRSVESLRRHYPDPPEMAIRKVLPHLDRHCRAFIAASPFIVLATAGADGVVNASPRGDPAGFVRVVDRATLLVPDRRGNNRIDALLDIVENPHASLLFIVPGKVETLRVSGRATITVAPDMLASLAMDGKPAKAAIRLAVEKAFFQCGKSLVRSRLWDPDSQDAADRLEPFGRVVAEQCRIGYDPALEDFIAQDYREGLY